MSLPFTSSEFLEVFGRYNEAMWPAALVLPALGLLCAWLILAKHRAARRVALVILGALWVWTALAYHLGFFAAINPVASWFAMPALAQAAMFFYASFGELRMTSTLVNVDRVVGGAIIAFSLVLYPALAYLAGHRYPEMPTFGLPCPTTIFTLGILAALHQELSWTYAIIPVAWAIVGTSAAMQLGMVEDLGLPAAAIALVALMAAHSLERRRVSRAPQVRAPRGAR
jgi:hypothetical protein